MSIVWTNLNQSVMYLGGRDGLEYRRHDMICQPGKWAVKLTGWHIDAFPAVVDDFGNLIQAGPLTGWWRAEDVPQEH